MSTFMGKDPMASQNASHPKCICVPTEEPFQCIDACQVGRYVRRQCLVCNVDTPSSHDGVTSDKVHGMEVGSFETFFGNDSFDFSLGGELGSLGIEWVVRAHPVSVLAGFDLVPRRCLNRLSSFSHGYCFG